MIDNIVGVILILFGVYLGLRNKEDFFGDLGFNIFKINKILIHVSLLLIILGIILILW
ncbi:MAG: hypothetical protein QXW35_00325 [Candidatus Aenigmatarchaeota archaeon]